MQNKVNHGSLKSVKHTWKIKITKCKENMNRQESNMNNLDKRMIKQLIRSLRKWQSS